MRRDHPTEVRVRTSLDCYRVPSAPSTDEELREMRAAAWRRQRIAVIRLDELTDPWERATVNAIAVRLYGGGSR